MRTKMQYPCHKDLYLSFQLFDQVKSDQITIFFSGKWIYKQNINHNSLSGLHENTQTLPPQYQFTLVSAGYDPG